MTDEVLLEPMTIGDYDEVRALDDSREDIDRFIRRNPTTSVVARVGGRIIGSILCGSDGRQGALYHVCVAKPWRRRGIGTMMVAYCMRELSSMGINKVSLIAFRSNDAGNAFWKNIGWTQSDVNYYEFILNENNITQFIGDDNGNA